ncbi:MAG: hypothetical protein ACYS0H_11500 [Planctomycetota bacterium]
MAEEDKSKPVKDFRAGNIQASIWRNEVEKEGQTVIRHSVRIQKQFKNDGGDYQETPYYFPDDLPKLILVAQRAFEFITLKESKDAGESVPVQRSGRVMDSATARLPSWWTGLFFDERSRSSPVDMPLQWPKNG